MEPERREPEHEADDPGGRGGDRDRPPDADVVPPAMIAVVYAPMPMNAPWPSEICAVVASDDVQPDDGDEVDADLGYGRRVVVGAELRVERDHDDADRERDGGDIMRRARAPP